MKSDRPENEVTQQREQSLNAMIWEQGAESVDTQCSTPGLITSAFVKN